MLNFQVPFFMVIGGYEVKLRGKNGIVFKQIKGCKEGTF